MQYEVILRLHEDDATGEWGLCNVDAVEKFNAFWGADGIFHDVFEHYMEGTHKYFRGSAAYQIWGEMCASGHGIAYANIGINNFKYRPTTYRPRDFTADTKGNIEAWIHDDYLDFPLDYCIVPRQSWPKVHYELGGWIAEYEYFIESIEDKEKRKMIRKSHMRNCYLLGYKMAQRIIGSDRSHAYGVLDKFLEDWNDITKHNNAKYLGIEGGEYGVYGFKFVVRNSPKLSVKCTILDDLRNEHHIRNLISY